MIHKFLLILFSPSVFAVSLESTVTFPKSIKRIGIENESAGFTNEYNGSGESNSISKAFEQNVNMLDLVSNPGDKTAIQAVLQENGIDPNLGNVDSSTNFNISVMKLRLQYGLTDDISLGIGGAYWNAQSEIKIGFQSNQSAQQVLNLPDLDNSQKEALARLFNDAQSTVNEKFTSVGIAPTGTWDGRGWGDTKAGAKYRFLKKAPFSSAITFASLFPTGVKDDPNNIQDVPFSQEAIIPEVLLVEQLDWWKFSFILTQLYMYPLKSDRSMRTSHTKSYFNSQLNSVEEQKGPTFQATGGISVQVLNDTFLDSYYKYSKQDAGKYSRTDVIEKQKKNDFTEVGGGLKYSTIRMFKKKKFFLPADIQVGYRQVLSGTNTKDLKSVDMYLQVYLK